MPKRPTVLPASYPLHDPLDSPHSCTLFDCLHLGCDRLHTLLGRCRDHVFILLQVRLPVVIVPFLFLGFPPDSSDVVPEGEPQRIAILGDCCLDQLCILLQLLRHILEA